MEIDKAIFNRVAGDCGTFKKAPEELRGHMGGFTKILRGGMQISEDLRI